MFGRGLSCVAGTAGTDSAGAAGVEAVPRSITDYSKVVMLPTAIRCYPTFLGFLPERRSRIRAEEVFGDFVLLVFFRAAFRDLGTDANAKVAGAVGRAGAF